MARGSAVVVKFLGDTTDLQKALGKAENETKSFSDRAKGILKTVGGAAALAGIVTFAKGSVEAFSESQKVMAQTEAVLKSTGGAANVTAKDISSLAGELQDLSGVEDETIQNGQNLLLTFTNIRNEAGKGNDVFNQATRIMTDMSVALGQDMKSSAIQLGKALNDPIKGVTALSRVGVSFTDVQKEQIRTMVESGDTMGAQKVILAELSKEFGGSAKAAGDNLAPNEKLRIKMGELQEVVGAKLVPALTKLADIGATVLTWITNMNGPTLVIIGTVLGMVAAVMAVSKAIQVWTTVQAALNVVLAMNPIGLVVLALAALVGGLVVAYKNSETFRNIVDTAFRAVAKAAIFMKDLILQSVGWMVDKFLGAAEMILKGAEKMFGWVPGLGGKLREAVAGVERFRDDVNRYLDGVKPVKTIRLELEDHVTARLTELRRRIDANLPSGVSLTAALNRYHDGGVVPGPIGREQLAVVKGGETILPTHKPGWQAVGEPTATPEWPDPEKWAEKAADALARRLLVLARAN